MKATVSKSMKEPERQVMCDVLLNARHAFELFEQQNVLLASSFDLLEQNLVESESELARKVSELRQLLSRLHCVLDSLADGVLVINLEGKIEFFNGSAKRILGVPKVDLQGRLYRETVVSAIQQKRMEMVIASGKPDLCYEIEMDCPQGGRMLLQSSMAPVISPTEGRLGVVEVFRDVTAMRQLERQFKHAQHMASLGEMAAGVAHELRNPLGAIEGFARLLRSDLERDGLAKYSRLAERIVEGTENLNYVITNLLDYARPVMLEYQMFSVRKLLDSLRDCLVGIINTRKVQVLVQSVEPEVEVFGDLRQLRHVLINLGRNAIEACEAGGMVRIDFYLYQGECAFHIADNGCGISAENMAKIFDPFFTTKHSGTGLGLSFCHKIVEAHGGEILVHSDATNGTVFQVVIPLWRQMQ